MPTTEVPNILRDLWRQRAQNLAAGIANGSREHREINHAASLIRQDYHDRFLVELIQNANDQAVRGDLTDSTIVIVRTQNLLAVSNGGQVVTQSNLERLSSLADSDKDGVLIGNKGVGFKAVYQITDTPEIFSATDGQHSIRENFNVGFALEQSPFKNEQLRQEIDEAVRDFLSENAGIAKALKGNEGHDPIDQIREEFDHVAGFKFPLERTATDLKNRIDELAIPDELLNSIGTLVVLPLKDEKASNTVENAIDNLLGTEEGLTGQIELAIMFLSGIGRIEVIDHVKEQRSSFSYGFKKISDSIQTATVTVISSDGEPIEKHYWMAQRDALDCGEIEKAERKAIVEEAISDFGLEAWTIKDPLPVTIALPMVHEDRTAPLGTIGRFCLGLPTQQDTGLPVHVDARFFATISRTGLDFDQPYNALLLQAATSLLGELFEHLKTSQNIGDRRTVTLALERTKGDLADQVFASDGIGDGEVILNWGGQEFITRRDSILPNDDEQHLLKYIQDVLPEDSNLLKTLPEEELLLEASSVLEILGLPELANHPHPWLTRDQVDESKDHLSVVEHTATQHRRSGTQFWEDFVQALIECFDEDNLLDQRWLPVGSTELAKPNERAFIPFSTTANADENEVTEVPPRIAGRIRILDGDTIPLRDGKDLSPLASLLEKKRIIKRPRKKELLEQALFPELEKAVADNDPAAIELLGQALTWIAAMSPKSRSTLDCKNALVPIAAPTITGYSWIKASESYIGAEWGLTPEHNDLLAIAYPDKRILPLGEFKNLLGLKDIKTADWSDAMKSLGVNLAPRIISIEPDKPPLTSNNYQLHVAGDLSLGSENLDPIYQRYIAHLADNYDANFSRRFPHEVEKTLWIEGLEHEERRQAIVELMLKKPVQYQARHSVTNIRKAGYDITTSNVPAMWVFALSKLDWRVFPAEQGRGGLIVHVSNNEVWSLSDQFRRSSFSRIINVIPNSLSDAAPLLKTLEVTSLAGAPPERLFKEIEKLSQRLEAEHLHSSQDALSLANELYRRIVDKLQGNPSLVFPETIVLPLLRNRRLEAVCPKNNTPSIAINDDPCRSQHVSGIDKAFGVPLASDVSHKQLYDLFSRSFTEAQVIRTSTAEIDLEFSPGVETAIPFLQWLQTEYPQTQVAAELAALLTYGNSRQIQSDLISRNWERFEELTLTFGEFGDPEITSYLDRSDDTLWVSSSLEPHEVVSKTWELAGLRSRDLWEAYSNALKQGNSLPFLHERGISEVEIIGVADEIGLHQKRSVTELAPALLAARCHMVPGPTMNDAAAWLSELADSAEDVSEAFDRPDLVKVITEALGLRPPEGELLIIRHLDIPWELWQDAMERNHGKRHVFSESVQRYKKSYSYLIAAAREIGVRETSIDLDSLSGSIAEASSEEVPDIVQYRPLEIESADAAALDCIRKFLGRFQQINRELEKLPPPPWNGNYPTPDGSTIRGTRLFREGNSDTRTIESTTSVEAILDIASRLAKTLSEEFEPLAIRDDSRLQARMEGEWAHVYSALLVLKSLLQTHAPVTAKRLAEIQAFRDPTTSSALLGKLPEIRRNEEEQPQQKQSIIGQELTDHELHSDLGSGTSGILGAKLAEAARQDLDPLILTGKRSPLPTPTESRKTKRGGGRGSHTSSNQNQSDQQTTGDLGEAFVHEWLAYKLGDSYGPDCWVSRSRERYGLPNAGDDSLGYDFKVSDSEGELFGTDSSNFLIEVKSTTSDGQGPFPMSSGEWDCARRCHEDDGDTVYVILRIFEANDNPRIGDAILDPFSAHRRGEVQLSDKDLWVTISPLLSEEPK